MAVEELGANDGDEVELSEDLENPNYAGDLIAEALLTRPELREALSSVGNLLIKKLRTGV